MRENLDETYKKMWDERYSSESYVYGKEPNKFFKDWLHHFKPGSILMPADGEGRNGVYAAIEGWAVTSLDLSEAGKLKALALADENNVDIDYIVGDFNELKFESVQFDCVGLIYAHVTASKKTAFHNNIDHVLKPGGVIIFEAFSKSHMEYNSKNPEVGGPKDLAMLYSEEEILQAFPKYEILMLAEQEIGLSEGIYHHGKGSVIRFVGRKQ